MLIFFSFRRQNNARKKYSFKNDHLTVAQQEMSIGSNTGMGKGTNTEQIEMKGPLDVVSDAGSYEDDGTTQQQEGENDDYFQDPASIGKCLNIYCTAIQHLFPFPVPVIDPIPTERFPEYVRDMLYGEENKLKAEFLVRSPYIVLPSFCERMLLCTYMTHEGKFE